MMSYTLNESISSLTSLSQRFQTATSENPITGQEVSDFGNHIKNVLNLLATSDIQISQVTTLLEVAKSANLQKDLEQSLDIDALKNLTTLLEVAKSANLQKDLEQDLKDVQHDALLADSAITDASQSGDIAALKIVKKDAANVFFVDRQYANQAEMIAQDAAALQGVSNRPFATPYSAKKAAILWLALNPTKQAIVEIARGNTFTAADYVATEHDVTVSMGGVDYVSGVELAFHGITYIFYGVTIETPIMNAVFLAAQAYNGLSVKKSVFYGGNIKNVGRNEHANSNIHFFDAENVSNYHDGAGGTSFQGDVGIKRLDVLNIESTVYVGIKWGSRGNSLVPENLSFSIGRLVVANPANGILYIPKMHNKVLHFETKVAKVYRNLLNLGHWTGTSEDGTLGGVENSNVCIRLHQLESNPSYVYVLDDAGGFIHIPNNKTSKFEIQLCDLGVLTVPKSLWVYGIQENNQYHLKDAKVKIDNAASVEMPFNLNLATSVLVLDGWDIESNVNNVLFTVTSGKLILRNCKIRQTANQPIFNISAGAQVVLENTHLVGKQLVSTGAGKIISKKSTSNVAIGTAILRGDLVVSKFYDESLSQTELAFSNTTTFEHGTQWQKIPNPNQLRFAVSETVSIPFGEVASIPHSGRTIEINNAKTVVDENGVVSNVVSLFMQQATAPNESKITVPYEFVPIGYVLGL